jgi:pimeloyl-ACP methyl ester carboxylesterase
VSQSSRKTFVLVHGAWHGAWCWHKVVPLLGAQGHQVIAPDLPAMGSDTTDPATITLEGWARFVADLIRRQPEPVVLVGHSRAGIVISQAAELIPARISRLVYLCAFLLPAGHNLAEAARADADSLVASNMVPAAGGVTCTVRDSALRDGFFGNCSDEDYAYARERVSPEPLKPLVTPLTVTPGKFGRVPRAYIECTRDRAVTLGAQRRMQAALPCDPVLALDSDHSPFLSQPEELALLLGGL